MPGMPGMAAGRNPIEQKGTKGTKKADATHTA